MQFILRIFNFVVMYYVYTAPLYIRKMNDIKYIVSLSSIIYVFDAFASFGLKSTIGNLVVGLFGCLGKITLSYGT